MRITELAESTRTLKSPKNEGYYWDQKQSHLLARFKKNNMKL